MHIYFSNPRIHPEMTLTTLGESGPILGPVNISWVNGKLRVNSLNWDQFHFLPTTDNGELIYINGAYYSDFEVWDDNSPLLEEHRKHGTKFFDWDSIINLPHAPCSLDAIMQTQEWQDHYAMVMKLLMMPIDTFIKSPTFGSYQSPDKTINLSSPFDATAIPPYKKKPQP